MPAPSETNPAERRRWNDDYWTAVWPVREQLTECATEPLLEIAALRAGERVVDVGSGCGVTAVLASSRVGAHGRVLAADISTPLLDVARKTAADAGATNVSFVEADVQTATLPGAPYDVVLSRFGVMFFDHPVEAFSNLRAQMVHGGRLAFACWQAPAENPWFLGHALGPLLPKPEPPAPGAHATGPFAFSDADDVTGILERAGWTDVAVHAHRGATVVDHDAIADRGQPAFLGVDPGRLDEAIEAIEAHASRFARPDGRLEVPVAFYVVGARTAD